MFKIWLTRHSHCCLPRADGGWRDKAITLQTFCLNTKATQPPYLSLDPGPFIYMNKIAAKDVANSAQSVFNFIWYGIGPLLAVLMNSLLANFFTEGKRFVLAEFQPFWYSLGTISLVGLIVFLIWFREQKETAEP